MTPHSQRRNWSTPPVLYKVSRGRSKIASRTAWRSVSTWADPAVLTSSTSRPCSRNSPSSRATKTAREWTALLTESRTFFNVTSVGITPPSQDDCITAPGVHLLSRLPAPNPLHGPGHTRGDDG